MLERGQSETLGFVFIFSLIVLIVGITFTTGFAGLQDVRDAERVNNAQRAFEVFADNIGDLVHRTAPSRATEIKLAAANLRIAESITVNVSVEGSSFNDTYEIRPIRYDADTRTELYYSQGAVIRKDGSDGIVASESSFLLDRNRTLIPILQTRNDGIASVGGDGSVLVRAIVSTRSIVHANESDGTTVWLNLTTPRAEAWHDHFSRKGDVTCEPVSDETVPCRVTTDHLYVTLSRIDLQIR